MRHDGEVVRGGGAFSDRAAPAHVDRAASGTGLVDASMNIQLVSDRLYAMTTTTTTTTTRFSQNLCRRAGAATRGRGTLVSSKGGGLQQQGRIGGEEEKGFT